jgi:hypothetical protein
VQTSAVYVITGGTRGIGAGVAGHLAGVPARALVLGYRGNHERAHHRLVAQLDLPDSPVRVLACDVSDPAQVSDLSRPPTGWARWPDWLTAQASPNIRSESWTTRVAHGAYGRSYVRSQLGGNTHQPCVNAMSNAAPRDLFGETGADRHVTNDPAHTSSIERVPTETSVSQPTARPTLHWCPTTTLWGL